MSGKGVDFVPCYVSDDELDEGDIKISNWLTEEDYKMSAAIKMVEMKLFTLSSLRKKDVGNKSDRIHSTDNYRGSIGYSAHSDAVDDKEIDTWQRNFPFLRILGTKKHIYKADISSSASK